MVADKGYDSAQLRRRLAERAIKTMIPERRLPEGKKRRKKRPHYRFDKATYKKRAAVEQSIGWIKECRRIATCFEKLAVNLLAMIKLAFIRYYLKLDSADTA